MGNRPEGTGRRLTLEIGRIGSSWKALVRIALKQIAQRELMLHRSLDGLTQRLRHAKLRYPASLEDIDLSTPRGLSHEVVLSLGTGGWVRDHHHLLITGPTGIGKSWLASAFV